MWCWCEQTLTFGVGFTQHGDGCGAGVNRPLTFGVGFTQHGDGRGAAVDRVGSLRLSEHREADLPVARAPH